MNLGKVNIWGNSCRHIASRLAELDELHLSIQKVSGYTVEQLLQMFLAGCEMKRPEYPSIEEIEKARYSYMMHEMSLLHRAIAKYGKGEFSQRQEITLGGSVKTSPMEKLTEEELRSLARLDGEQDDEE